MKRVDRAGRKRAIIGAILKLNFFTKKRAHTKGEICRKMGVTSQSKIRYILDEMVKDGTLVAGTCAIASYAHELTVYSIAEYEQIPLPEKNYSIVKINGVDYWSDGVEVNYGDLPF